MMVKTLLCTLILVMTLRKIDYINYFDTSRRKIKRELYDTRGFLSCTRILSTDQKIQSEFYYSPSGEVKLKSTLILIQMNLM